MSPRIKYLGSPIRSVSSLASTLSCEENRLTHIANNIDDFYDTFSRPKKSGKLRTINAPKRELKIIQKRINSRIFSHCIFPAYLQGSVKDHRNPRDFVSNADLHSHSRSFVLADIQDFYPSVHPSRVNDIFKYLFLFSAEVTDLLVRLTTLGNTIPQGAPTSSYLANLVFYDNEYKIVQDFHREKLVYSRLIDDITVSSPDVLSKEKKGDIVKKISSMVAQKGMKLHRGKLQILDSRGPGVVISVTGLNIEKGAPRLPPSSRKKIRYEVYACKKKFEAGHQNNDEYHKEHNSVSGSVALMSRLKYVASDNYRATLQSCLPTYDYRKQRKLIALCKKFVANKGTGSETVDYARRYHKLTYRLGILSRTKPNLAKNLKLDLRAYRPKMKISEVEDEYL